MSKDYTPTIAPSTPTPACTNMEALTQARIEAAQERMRGEELMELRRYFAADPRNLDHRGALARFAALQAEDRSYRETGCGLRVGALYELLGEPDTIDARGATWVHAPRFIQIPQAPTIRSVYLREEGAILPVAVHRFHATTAEGLATWLLEGDLDAADGAHYAQEVARG